MDMFHFQGYKMQPSENRSVQIHHLTVPLDCFEHNLHVSYWLNSPISLTMLESYCLILQTHLKTMGFPSNTKLWMLVGGFKHEWIIFHFIYGMSSFPLTNSIIFQDGEIAPVQEPFLGVSARKGHRGYESGIVNVDSQEGCKHEIQEFNDLTSEHCIGCCPEIGIQTLNSIHNRDINQQ